MMCQDKLTVDTEHDQFELQGRICNLSAFAHVPTNRTTTYDRTFYNVPKDLNDRKALSTYDRLFEYGVTPGYNQKLHRCDRDNAKSRGLNVNKEENQKIVGSLSSSIYGHPVHPAYDSPGRDHVRICLIKSEFYRNNGVNLKPEETEH